MLSFLRTAPRDRCCHRPSCRRRHCQTAVGSPPTTFGYPPTAVGSPPTAIGYPPTAIGFPATAIGYPPTAIGFPATAIGYPPTAIGFPATAIGYPPTAIGWPPAPVDPPPTVELGWTDASRVFFFFSCASGPASLCATRLPVRARRACPRALTLSGSTCIPPSASSSMPRALSRAAGPTGQGAMACNGVSGRGGVGWPGQWTRVDRRCGGGIPTLPPPPHPGPLIPRPRALPHCLTVWRNTVRRQASVHSRTTTTGRPFCIRCAGVHDRTNAGLWACVHLKWKGHLLRGDGEPCQPLPSAPSAL